MVQWDETSPRPYTRHNLIQGTQGILAGFPTRVALEGGFEEITKNHHSWVEGEHLEALYEKYDHPLYKRLNQKTQNSGHGGMDGIMVHRITPLSGASIAQDGAPQQFPDFTVGRWKETPPLEIIS